MDIFDFLADSDPPPANGNGNGAKPKREKKPTHLGRKGWKQGPRWEPTLEEIAAGCLEVQATWSAADEASRRDATLRPPPPLPQAFAVAGVPGRAPRFAAREIR